MNICKIRVVACNPKNEGQVTEPLEALVDTGTELTWLPAELLWSIGVTPRQRKAIEIAPEQIVVRGVGYAILRANGQETPAEVVFAEPGDRPRLGVRTLQGFGIEMDSAQNKFIDLATLAAFKNGQKSVVKFRLKL